MLSSGGMVDQEDTSLVDRSWAAPVNPAEWHRWFSHRDVGPLAPPPSALAWGRGERIGTAWQLGPRNQALKSSDEADATRAGSDAVSAVRQVALVAKLEMIEA